MKRFFARQPAVPRIDSTPAGERQADGGTTTGAIQRRRFARALLVSVPVAAAAVAATVEPQPVQAASVSDSWKMEGNANVDGNDFLGTNNAKPLIFKTNKSERMRIREDGLMGIGTSPGGAQLAVSSQIGGAIRGETTAGSAAAGVLGLSSSSFAETAGVRGAHLAGGIGVVGTSDTSSGSSSTTGIGVKGTAVGNNSDGVRGESNGDFSSGLSGRASGYSSRGVDASSDGQNGIGVDAFVSGANATAVKATTTGSSGAAVFARTHATSGTGYGVYGQCDSPTGYAGYFYGRVHVQGTLSKAAGSFKIDHPLDPANKYLSHSFVESPDMLNVYSGNVTTDAGGDAMVQLPAYFEALNRDFRYQLTVIGRFAQAIVADEIDGNRFTIKTDRPRVKVSWQVTGIRQDAYARAHPIPVEEDKPSAERGSYLSPLEHGQPVDRGRDYSMTRTPARASDER